MALQEDFVNVLEILNIILQGHLRCIPEKWFTLITVHRLKFPSVQTHVSDSIFVLQDNIKFKQALKIRNPKNRLKRIYDACKSKKVCAGGDDLDVQEQDTDEPVKKRGGCGAQQPNITVDGMKMVAEYKSKKKTDDQDQLPKPEEREQILSAERVFL